MIRHIRSLSAVFAILFLISTTAGCAINIYKYRPKDKEKISQLSNEVEMWKKQNEELENAKKLLEQRLATEIGKDQVRLEMAERGLVITFVSEILFDSGKSELRPESFPMLDKVAGVIKEKVSDRDIGVEGHTDNAPIKRSGWKSNWELSTARATSVLHYMADNCGLDPRKLAATGYGEFRPVASNDTPQGMQKNRRVEVIILPKGLSRIEFEKMSKPANMPEGNEGSIK